jgi:Zn-dependent protease with chaperone function
MNEAAFPLVGPVLVFTLALPVSALLAKALLWAVGQLENRSNVPVPPGVRYAILVASSAVPLAWFISASLHQAESGASALVCAAIHAPGAFCAEAAYFSLALLLLAGASGVPRLAREQFPRRSSPSMGADAVRRRLSSLVAGRESLRSLEGRLAVSDMAPAITTVGVISPRVIVRTSFAEALDDEALASALHHELEHVRGRDPLRYFAVWWALAVNPFGSWMLRAEHARWLLSREAHCDRNAVFSGASASALAHALVIAARPARVTMSPALGCGHLAAVKLRIGLLLAYADKSPRRGRDIPGLRLVSTLLVFVLVLPHGGGTEPLDAVHEASESAVALFTNN